MLLDDWKIDGGRIEPDVQRQSGQKETGKAMEDRKKPELLIPAGSLEVLKTAVIFGADAVYIGGEAFGLRAKAKNFTPEEMAEGIAFAHAKGVKVYVTANIFAHNEDLERAADYFASLRDMTPERCDALIISDPGMFAVAREVWPQAEIHISTQANNTNYRTYRFWWELGAKRVVSARELTLAEIRAIRERIPQEMEIESFVQGSMCISYSGRCLLSNYFTGRDANQGACTHPCRWKYALMEETRPGEYLPVYENERGTYIFNSKDLCMIEHIPELVEAGIDSLKVEGRMKTALYIATVARTYRKAIDDYFVSEETYQANMDWYRAEIAKCTYRQFTTGFYFGKPGEEAQIYDNSTYVNEYIYLGIIEETAAGEAPWGEKTDEALTACVRKPDKGEAPCSLKPDNSAEVCGLKPDNSVEACGSKPDKSVEACGLKPDVSMEACGLKPDVSMEACGLKPDVSVEACDGKPMAGELPLVRFEQRNKFAVGDTVEIMKPDGRNIPVLVEAMYNEEGEPMESCPHARQMIWAKLSEVAEPYDLLRVENLQR